MKEKMLKKAKTLGLLNKELTDKDKILLKNPGFEYIRKLGVGDSFGEIALTQTTRRTASICCSQNCDLLVLSKFDYEDIIKNIEKQLQNLKIKELK